MTFTITKIAPNNFSHFDGFKEMNFSNWEINFNNTTNTIILQLRNGAPFPKREVLASEVIIKDGISGTPEIFSTTEQIRTRLLALNYNPLQSSVVGSAEWGGIGGDIENQTDLIEKLDEKISKDTIELTEKTTIVDGDIAIIGDSEDLNKAKKSTWLNIKNYFANLFILRSGTTAGNPIIGDLSYDTLDGVQRNIKFIDAGENENYIYFGNDGSNPDLAGYFGLYSKNPLGFSDFNFAQNEWILKEGAFRNSAIIETLGFRFLSDNPDAVGFRGSSDFTPNITDLDYTQKKYVDTKAPLNPRVQSITSSATVTPTSTNDIVTITAQAVALTLANPTGTFAEGQALMIRIKDNGTARAITFGSNYRAIGVTLPTTTTVSKTIYLGVIYNSTDAKWDVLGINLQA